MKGLLRIKALLFIILVICYVTGATAQDRDCVWHQATTVCRNNSVNTCLKLGALDRFYVCTNEQAKVDHLAVYTSKITDTEVLKQLDEIVRKGKK